MVDEEEEPPPTPLPPPARTVAAVFAARSEPSECDELNDSGAYADTCEKLFELDDFVSDPLPPVLLRAFVVV